MFTFVNVTFFSNQKKKKKKYYIQIHEKKKKKFFFARINDFSPAIVIFGMFNNIISKLYSRNMYEYIYFTYIDIY